MPREVSTCTDCNSRGWTRKGTSNACACVVPRIDALAAEVAELRQQVASLLAQRASSHDVEAA